MIVAGTIAARDLELLHVTDNLDDAIAILDRCAEGFGLRRRRAPAPSRWLGSPPGSRVQCSPPGPETGAR